MAVNKSGTSIQYIKEPSEKVQLAAIKETLYAYQHIKNPSEKVMETYHKMIYKKVLGR
jgi:hypothetical protein